MKEDVQFQQPVVKVTDKFSNAYTTQISSDFGKLIRVLRCSVLTAPLTPYSPKDQIESVYGLKRVLTDMPLYRDDVMDLLIDYVQTTLNPFLVEWHAHFHYNDLGDYSDLSELTTAFHEALKKLRQYTAVLQTKLEEMLDEME